MPTRARYLCARLGTLVVLVVGVWAATPEAEAGCAHPTRHMPADLVAHFEFAGLIFHAEPAGPSKLPAPCSGPSCSRDRQPATPSAPSIPTAPRIDPWCGALAGPVFGPAGIRRHHEDDRPTPILTVGRIDRPPRPDAPA